MIVPPNSRLGGRAYVALIALMSACILLIFLRPGEWHDGINDNGRTKFMDMVNGRAYRPYVYRTLLPSTIRLLTSITPDRVQRDLSSFVEKDPLARPVFERLNWETSAAYPYLLSSLLMWVCIFGFAHFAASFVMHTCGIHESFAWRLGLAAVALLGLPAFFRFTSYIYDPPQLLLFTLALLLLARGNIGPFLVIFPFVCANKETAILLIPVCAFVCRNRYSRGKYFTLLAGLVVTYAVVKYSISYAFRNNPGSFVEVQIQLFHNVGWITRGWSFPDLVSWSVLLLLLFFGWRQKAQFLRVSFLLVLLPLVGLAVFCGFLDEWRGYYEAYPIALSLILDSILRIRTAFRPGSVNLLHTDLPERK